MNAFLRADILLPKLDDLSDWSVVACDQYTSEPAYWERVDARTAGKPSAQHLILPEAQLSAPDVQERIAAIHETMDDYLRSGCLPPIPGAISMWSAA